MQNGSRKELLRRLEGAALENADRGEPESFDLIRAAEGDGEPDAPDLTFRGYVETHDRVPAFEGSDGQPYTVDIDTEEGGEGDRRFAAFLVFVRWAETGAGIMGHVTTEDVAFGATEDEARAGVLDLNLFELKTELDRAIDRRDELLGGSPAA